MRPRSLRTRRCCETAEGETPELLGEPADAQGVAGLLLSEEEHEPQSRLVTEGFEEADQIGHVESSKYLRIC